MKFEAIFYSLHNIYRQFEPAVQVGIVSLPSPRPALTPPSPLHTLMLLIVQSMCKQIIDMIGIHDEGCL